MKVNDSADKDNSIYHYTLFLLNLDSSDTTSYPTTDFMRSLNSWYRRLVFLIWRNAAFWEFDDSNYTTLPIATRTMVDGQQDYALPTNALDVQRVEVKNSSGNFQVLKQLDKSFITDIALSEYYKNPGMPVYYDLIGNSLILYPPPSSGNTTLTSGLKLYLARDIDDFDASETTREPGIEVGLHPYLAYGAALDYAIAKNFDPNKIIALRNELNHYEARTQEYAVRRNRDFKTRIRPAFRNNL